MERLLQLIDRWVKSALALGPARLSAVLVPAILAIGIAMFFINEEINYVAPTACAADRMPGRCWRMPKETCEFLWTRFDESCRKAIAKLPLSPGKLTGPMQFKCQLAKLDRMLGYSRLSTPECDQTLRDVREWAKRNEDILQDGDPGH